MWILSSMQPDTTPLLALYVLMLWIVSYFLGYLVLGLVRMSIRLLKALFTYIRNRRLMT
jgi:hypothetical protein